ncbi:MAG: hypothetical protein KGI50_03275 [Patescibacteria group bacterium]|nr:hypothetical protein [Patescibacteria group bacterium]MDE2438312.1 hypothetical protein [Patescibacteria group bacterium]
MFSDNNRGGGYNRGDRPMYPAKCADCGKDTEVPFQPRGDRPVYCSDCFRANHAQSRPPRRDFQR